MANCQLSKPIKREKSSDYLLQLTNLRLDHSVLFRWAYHHYLTTLHTNLHSPILRIRFSKKQMLNIAQNCFITFLIYCSVNICVMIYERFITWWNCNYWIVVNDRNWFKSTLHVNNSTAKNRGAKKNEKKKSNNFHNKNRQLEEKQNYKNGPCIYRIKCIW